MNLVAGRHYDVRRYVDGARRGQIRDLACIYCCEFTVGVVALHKTGDKSGAPRYCRARAQIVKHIHAKHRIAAAISSLPSGVGLTLPVKESA